jgi:putative ABC transport system permease protein
MRTLWQDLRYALRMLRKNLMLTVVIVVSLGIGIGANSAIFSVVDALLLRPLPYPHPERLAAVWLHSPAIGILRDWPSPGEYLDVQRENHSFEKMALAGSQIFVLAGREQPERLFGVRAQSSLLEMLGAKPLLGRLLLPEEDKPGRPDVAILTERIWKRLFNADPAILGKTITLNGNPFVVVGVLRRDFMLDAEVMPTETPMDKMDIFAPLPLAADGEKIRRDENYNIMVRLKPGVSVQLAQADLDVIASRIREKDERDASFGMHVIGLQEQVVGDVRRALLVLLGSVGLVLFIACSNVANLLLTRAAGREKEVAIRTALGASWKRLARQLLSESVLLGVLGGAAGLLVAQLSLSVVRTMNPGNIPRLEDVTINGTVLVFTFGVALITGVLFGVAPVWRAIKVDLNTSLKAGGRSGQSEGGLHVRRHSLRGLLVVSELALSLMLLIGAGLLLRSFLRLQNVPPGFTTERVLTMEVAAAGPKYYDHKPQINFFKEVESRVAHLPGVVAEGAISGLPLSGDMSWGGINVEGYVPPPGQEMQADMRVASTDYFRTMEIQLRKGRFFNEDDTAEKMQVAIIDEKFAQRFWPDSDPIGKRLSFKFNPERPMMIVGVVGVVKQYGLETEGKIAAYFPFEQYPGQRMFLAVRSSTEPTALSSAVIAQVHAVDPNVVVYDIRTMAARLSDSLARQRFSSTMLGAFAVFALLLAAVGLYGVMSHLVTQGTHDIGVLVTLGAQPGNIVGLVVRQGVALAGIGIILGLAGAAALTRVMASLLFEVSARDVATFAAVPTLLVIVALAAIAIPAWRATRIDPMVALRHE